MPYKDKDRQREACRLAMKRYRKRVRIEKILLRYYEDIFRNIDKYHFFIGDGEYAIVPEENLHQAMHFTLFPIKHMKHFKLVSVNDPKDSNTAMLNPVVWDDAVLLPRNQVNAKDVSSFRYDKRIYELFKKRVHEEGMDICYVMNALLYAYAIGKPIKIVDKTSRVTNYLNVNLTLNYAVEKPRRIVEKASFEKEVWMDCGKEES